MAPGMSHEEDHKEACAQEMAKVLIADPVDPAGHLPSQVFSQSEAMPIRKEPELYEVLTDSWKVCDTPRYRKLIIVRSKPSHCFVVFWLRSIGSFL